ITIQYDGTDYHGWQIQPNGRTIQGELTRVLSLLDRRHVTVHGAGRTDAGVHAEGQVASFLLEREFDLIELRDAINGNLDRDIRVFDVQIVDDSFNARLSARRKTYRYQIWNAEVLSPFLRRYVYHHRDPLDLEAMRCAASVLSGTHDFSAFTVARSDATDHVRTIESVSVSREGSLVTIKAIADGFLRYMVRTIAGTLIEIGRGHREAGEMAGILASRERGRAGPTASAAGLTLMSVDY
ncbi:MAG TPA: tRNA pseudouridine(38-40) synthase TruA, partial [Blastocatellia bacterium]|nr:tRNA pseudouridine(38-40) synthase TruA [Blastocatellia bacterium]